MGHSTYSFTKNRHHTRLFYAILRVSNFKSTIGRWRWSRLTTLPQLWDPSGSRSSHWRCFVKKSVLDNFANFTWVSNFANFTCAGVSFLIKKTPTQMFSCEIVEIFKNTWTTAKDCFCGQKIPLFKYHFNKPTGLQACNFIKEIVLHRCFLVSF